MIDKTDIRNDFNYFKERHFERFSKNLSFLTNPRSVSQTVKELELCKEKHYFAKMHFYIGIVKLKWAKFLLKLNEKDSNTRLALKESTFKELSDDLRS